MKKSYTATSDWFNFEGNDSLLFLMGLHWAMDCWKIMLFIRQLSVARKAVIPPPQLIGRISVSEYKIMRASSIARSIVSIVALFILLAAKTLKMVLNYHPFLWELTGHYGDTPLYRAALYAAFDEISTKLLLLPFAMFAVHLSLKSLFAIMAVFLASILQIFFSAMLTATTMMILVKLTDIFGPELLFNAPVVSNLIGLVTMAYYIEFVVPDKLIRINTTNQQLKHHLELIANRVEFPIDRIYIDDGLPVPNAYFAGVFGANMIAVTPSLVKIMGNRQVTSVVAHELGHWAHHHNSVLLMYSMITVLSVSYGLFLTYDSSTVNQTFRFLVNTIYSYMYVLLLKYFFLG